MKPRASMPTTRSTLPRPKWTTVSSITDENATWSASNGVMSLKITPSCGQSGTSRIRERSLPVSIGTIAPPSAASPLRRRRPLPAGGLAALLGWAWLLRLALAGGGGGARRLLLQRFRLLLVRLQVQPVGRVRLEHRRLVGRHPRAAPGLARASAGRSLRRLLVGRLQG